MTDTLNIVITFVTVYPEKFIRLLLLLSFFCRFTLVLVCIISGQDYLTEVFDSKHAIIFCAVQSLAVMLWCENPINFCLEVLSFLEGSLFTITP